MQTPERKVLSKNFSADMPFIPEGIPGFDGRPKTPAEVRIDKYAEIQPSTLALKLASTEDELTAHRLQGAKRLLLFLNRRLEHLISEWKDSQRGPADAASKETERLSRAISEGRSAVEEPCSSCFPSSQRACCSVLRRLQCALPSRHASRERRRQRSRPRG